MESKKNFKDPNASGWSSSNGSSVASKYTLSTNLYVQNKAGKYVKVKLSASSVAKALKDKKKEIRNYIKIGKIVSINSRNELQKLSYDEVGFNKILLDNTWN